MKKILFLPLYPISLILRRPKGYAILMYHRIIEDEKWNSLLNPDVRVKLSDFREQIKFIKEKCKPLSLSEMICRIGNNIKPDDLYVAVTFDDGYADNYLLGGSILEEYGIQATIFVSTEYIDKRDKLLYWDKIINYARTNNDEVILSDVGDHECCFKLDSMEGKKKFVTTIYKWLYQDPKLTRKAFDKVESKNSNQPPLHNDFFSWDLLRQALASGNYEVGSHTMTHPVLKFLDDRGQKEIRDSKSILEKKLLLPINIFSYPLGGDNAITQEVISNVEKAGYFAALTNYIGINNEKESLFLLKRIPILGGEGFQEFKTKLYGANLLRWIYGLKRS